MRALDLFSGIGGIALAAEWAGIETAAFCEIEPYCRRVLSRHWPGVPIYEDVRELTKERLERDGVIDDVRTIDIVLGGYPCQPFSVAGKRRGAEDDRHLWPEMFRLVQELRPAWVLGENVAGHIHLGLDDVLADLESEGYSCRAFVLPACAVGAPHRRDRVFIVAHTEGKQDRRIQQPGIQSDAGAEGAASMAHASRQLPYGSGDARRRRAEPPDGGQDVADTQGPGSPGGRIRGGLSEENTGLERVGEGVVKRRRPAQSRVGRDFARISSGMDTDRLIRGGNSALSQESGPDQILSALRETAGAQEVQRKAGRSKRFSEAEVLQSDLCELGATEGGCNSLSIPQESSEIQEEFLREMRFNREFTMPSSGWKPTEQYTEQCRDIVRILSHEMALGAWKEAAEKTVGLQNLWRACAEIGYVPETLSALQKVWQSLSHQEKSWAVVRASGRIPWPAAFGEPQHDWEPPRVAVGVKNRVPRLKALGNAVVPQQVYPILRAIKEAHERRRER